MNVNFSVSENELFSYRDNVAKGLLVGPKDSKFQVQLTLADGSIFPNMGYISFANPSFSKDTGTFLVRAVFKNPDGQLRPGQFVRAKVSGASRKNAIMCHRLQCCKELRAILYGLSTRIIRQNSEWLK